MFANRNDAGRRLAARLTGFTSERLVVLGLPRGGVPVAFEVACALGAPLDVIVVRKLGVPLQPELAMGAIGEDGVRIINEDVVRFARITQADFATVEAREAPRARAPCDTIPRGAGPRLTRRQDGTDCRRRDRDRVDSASGVPGCSRPRRRTGDRGRADRAT